jgi:hypothetical protein
MWTNAINNKVQSYVTASLSWNKTPIWGLRPDLYYRQTVAGLLIWDSYERTILITKVRFVITMLSVCLCIPLISYWMAEPVFMMSSGTWAHLDCVLHKSLPISLCVYVCIPLRLSKNVTAATNIHATVEELLDASFSVRSMSYQGKFSNLLITRSSWKNFPLIGHGDRLIQSIPSNPISLSPF